MLDLDKINKEMQIFNIYYLIKDKELQCIDISNDYAVLGRSHNFSADYSKDVSAIDMFFITRNIRFCGAYHKAFRLLMMVIGDDMKLCDVFFDSVNFENLDVAYFNLMHEVANKYMLNNNYDEIWSLLTISYGLVLKERKINYEKNTLL